MHGWARPSSFRWAQLCPDAEKIYSDDLQSDTVFGCSLVSHAETAVKTWKWITLTVSGGTLLALGTCATDLMYYAMQAAATQLVTGALSGS